MFERDTYPAPPDIAIENPVEIPADEAKERFTVTDKATANWVLQRLIDLDAEERDALRMYADTRAKILPALDRLDAWREKELTRIDSRRAYFSGLLETYHRDYLASHPKEKTLSLPFGELRIRKQPDTVAIDQAAAAAALAARDDALAQSLLTVTVSVNQGEVRALLRQGILTALPDGTVLQTATGEVLPGITASHQASKFTVHPASGETGGA